MIYAFKPAQRRALGEVRGGGHPTLVFIDGAIGETINANGRAAVGADPEGRRFPWRAAPKALRRSTGPVCVVM